MIAIAIPSPTQARLLLLTAVFAAGVAAQAPGLPADRTNGAAAVDVAKCKEWLGTLAGAEFEGRGTGQPGFEKAANYVAAHFKALGLEARGKDGTYFQHVPWGVAKIDAEKTLVRFSKGGSELLTIPADRLSGTATAAMSAKGDAVLLVVELPPSPPREDGQRRFVMPDVKGLDNLDLKGKVVLVHLRSKDEKPSDLGAFAVTRALQGKETAATLFVQTAETTGGLRGQGGSRRPGGNLRLPLQATFGGADLGKLLGAVGMNTEALATAPILTDLGMQAQVEVAVAEGQAPAMNVFAVLPGSDPKLKDEYVVIGSHLDHLGKRGDRIFYGADDDGSGTTGVMAVAQMFAKNAKKPARSILFVCFSGEENGLVGSGYFADNCPIPLSSIVSELQMDMIGRDEEENMEGNKGEKAEDNRNSLHVVGTKKLAPRLHDLCLEKNATAKFDIEYDQEGMFGRSDHANFAKHGVPVAFFFTGLHRDYHQTSDTPDKIHYEKLLRVATYVYDIGFELATMPGRPEIDPELWTKYRNSNRNQSPEQPAAPLMGGEKATGNK